MKPNTIAIITEHGPIDLGPLHVALPKLLELAMGGLRAGELGDSAELTAGLSDTLLRVGDEFCKEHEKVPVRLGAAALAYVVTGYCESVLTALPVVGIELHIGVQTVPVKAGAVK